MSIIVYIYIILYIYVIVISSVLILYNIRYNLIKTKNVFEISYYVQFGR